MPAPIDLTSAVPAARTLTIAALAGVVEELAAYHAHFAPLFRRAGQQAWAQVYLRGLLTADVPRKNAEALALRPLGAATGAHKRVRALQQFLGAGGWDDAGILAARQRLVDETLGEADGVLIIDGHETPKQGAHSVGVARQWRGHTRKQDNCQAGVHLGYASPALLDRWAATGPALSRRGGARHAGVVPDRARRANTPASPRGLGAATDRRCQGAGADQGPPAPGQPAAAARGRVGHPGAGRALAALSAAGGE